MYQPVPQTTTSKSSRRSGINNINLILGLFEILPHMSKERDIQVICWLVCLGWFWLPVVGPRSEGCFKLSKSKIISFYIFHFQLMLCITERTNSSPKWFLVILEVGPFLFTATIKTLLEVTHVQMLQTTFTICLLETSNSVYPLLKLAL